MLFDGACNLCNGFVQFVMRHDQRNVFMFGSLQHPDAERLLFPVSTGMVKPDSIVLLEEGRPFTGSTAVLKIMRRLGGVYPLIYGFVIVPRFLRDAVYRLVARHRYSLFGRRNECINPAPGMEGRLISSLRDQESCAEAAPSDSTLPTVAAQAAVPTLINQQEPP